MAGLQVAPARVLEGINASDFFGNAVAGVGDLNRDGFDDVAVGANRASPGGRLSAGTASVFYGTMIGISMAAARVFEGAAADDWFGFSVASLHSTTTPRTRAHRRPAPVRTPRG